MAATIPRLPVPKLQDTCERFLKTIAPLVSPGELEDARSACKEFLNGEGPELQELLLQYDRSEHARDGSYIETFWDDAYLAPRDPIPINVNPFFIIRKDPSPAKNDQLTRAASLAAAFLNFHLRIKQNQLTPDLERGKPLCMSQYGKLFGAARIPHVTRDMMRFFSHSRHIVVMHRRRFYWFNVLDENDSVLSEADIRTNLEEITRSCASPGPAVGALTAENRTTWAVARGVMELNPTNARTLAMIDSSLFMIVLEDRAPRSTREASELMLHGDGRSRWFDKGIQLIVCTDGESGINMEHSAFDGHTLLRLATESYNMSVKDAAQAGVTKFATRTAPQELPWELDATVKKFIADAEKAVDALIADNESFVLHIPDFGRRDAIGHKLSPDALVQMAYQLAYYKHHHAFAGTYESALTKAFQHGRTEAMRSVTPESCAFVHNMCNPQASAANKRAALAAACEAHVRKLGDAKAGFGVDRHLLALRMFANLLGKAPRLFAIPQYRRSLCESVLSTSNCGSSSLTLFGFGPVVPHGYGLGYIIHDHAVIVNITSKHRETEVFMGHLRRAFEEIRQMLEASKPPIAARL